jgi:uncharacterized protein Smg (DUF494 family)
MKAAMQSTETNLQLRLWTVEEYHRMNEEFTGYFVLTMFEKGF